MKGKFALLLMATVLIALPVLASDLTGSWKSTVEVQGRSIERTFVLKQDGEKLTGKIVNARGETEIKEGKVKGEAFEFSVQQPGRGGGEGMTVTYKGKVAGDKITGSMATPQGEREFTATKEK